MTDVMSPSHARNMRIIGHTDQGGRPDAVQVMVHKGFAYVGHMFSKGFSIIDVRDPKNPRAAGYIAAPIATTPSKTTERMEDSGVGSRPAKNAGIFRRFTAQHRL